MAHDLGRIGSADRAGGPTDLSRCASQPVGAHPLRDLVTRLEAASGPDRELDRALTHAFWAIFGGDPHKWANKPPPAFTASIDAALTLVPEGWPSVCVGTTDDGRGYAELAGDDARMMACDPDESWVEGDAATTAIAICIAALRARQGDA